MNALPIATLVHESRGRLRVRVHEKRGDMGWFERVASQLGGHPSVREVETRARTGSILVFHRGARWGIEAWVRERGLFEVWRAQPATSVERVWGQLSALHSGLKSDDVERKLNGVLFYLLAGGAVLQLVRGNFLPAGEALVLQMLQLLERTEGDVEQRRTGQAADGETRG